VAETKPAHLRPPHQEQRSRQACFKESYVQRCYPSSFVQRSWDGDTESLLTLMPSCLSITFVVSSVSVMSLM
jgi:hypothetical protein